uniref:Uncharacterized protein n=1 Tax=Anguilla anguilla TaxID=7936 RepID=A0A0E9R6R0_ANGAN
MTAEPSENCWKYASVILLVSQRVIKALKMSARPFRSAHNK